MHAYSHLGMRTARLHSVIITNCCALNTPVWAGAAFCMLVLVMQPTRAMH